MFFSLYLIFDVTDLIEYLYVCVRVRINALTPFFVVDDIDVVLLSVTLSIKLVHFFPYGYATDFIDTFPYLTFI